MPGALLGHASSMSANPAPQGGEVEAGGSGMQTGMIAQDVRRAGQPKKDVPVCPTDDEAIVPRRKTRNTSRQSWDYVWKSGVAGGLAGCAAKSLVAPLDRVKILFQASNPQYLKYTGSWFGVVTAMRDIYRTEGPLGLFRGHSATILRIFPYAGIKFLAYEQIRGAIIKGPDQETPLRRLLSGAIAGVTSVFTCYPLELIRVRLAFETKKDHRSSLRDICRKIYHEHPPVPKPLPSANVASAASALSNGGMAAPVAATAKTLVNSATNSIDKITPRAGLANFYRGFSPTLLGMLPYAGMSFLTHDTVGDLFRHPSIAAYTTRPRPANYPENKPAPLVYWAELTSGGIAGLVSQTASYPLEVIRRRMQVGGAVGDGHRLRMAETAGLILREKGFRGFFVGLGIGYVKVVPMAAVSFYTYEKMKIVLGI